MLSLSRTIISLKENILSLNTDVEVQHKECNLLLKKAIRLKRDLRETQSTLAHCIMEYRKELESQRILVEKQGEILYKLLGNRLKIDLLIDIWFVSHNLIVPFSFV
jgi:hypothetical protein